MDKRDEEIDREEISKEKEENKAVNTIVKNEKFNIYTKNSFKQNSIFSMLGISQKDKERLGSNEQDRLNNLISQLQNVDIQSEDCAKKLQLIEDEARKILDISKQLANEEFKATFLKDISTDRVKNVTNSTTNSYKTPENLTEVYNNFKNVNYEIKKFAGTNFVETKLTEKARNIYKNFHDNTDLSNHHSGNAYREIMNEAVIAHEEIKHLYEIV